jgi:hypothetical protein
MDGPEHDRGPAYKPLALIIVKRTAIFLLVICVVSLFYWIVGSVSSFLDTTQAMLLDLMRLSSLGLLIAAGIGIILSLALAVLRRHSFRILGILGYLACAGLGAAALAIAQSVSILARGLR